MVYYLSIHINNKMHWQELHRQNGIAYVMMKSWKTSWCCWKRTTQVTKHQLLTYHQQLLTYHHAKMFLQLFQFHLQYKPWRWQQIMYQQFCVVIWKNEKSRKYVRYIAYVKSMDKKNIILDHLCWVKIKMNMVALSQHKQTINIYSHNKSFLFIWVNFVSSDADCCSLKSVHNVVESHQTQYRRQKASHLLLCFAATLRQEH